MGRHLGAFGRSRWPLGLALAALLVAGLEARPPSKAGRGFGLEEIILGQLSSRGFNGVWISGSEFIFSNSNTSDVDLYDVTTAAQSVLIEKAVLDQYQASSYELSPDQLFLMLRYDMQPGFRHSSSAKCVIYDLTTKEYASVGDGQLLELAAWAPIGHSLAFVRENDVYYRGEDGVERRVTDTGVPGVVYNGVADWVYEEEVLGSGSALWFSPNATHLAFASFNDTEVRVATYFHYGEPGAMGSQYSEAINLRYPKPGTPNPAVTLNVVDLTAPEFVQVSLAAPTGVVSEDNVLAEVSWAGPRVSAVWANRVQNVVQVTEYDTKTGIPLKPFVIREGNGWIDVQQPQYDSTGDSFLTLMSHTQGAIGKFRHLTIVTDATAKSLTSGRLVVTNIYAWDEPNGIVYYQATPERSPSQRHVYAVTQDGVGTPLCLSCDVKTVDDNDCTYASASFSTDASHYALTCSGPDVPHVALYRTDAATLLTVWEDNAELREKIKDRALPEVVNAEIDVPGGFKANVRMLLPPGSDTSGDTKYPLLVFVYAGPNSVQISDAFSLSWGTYLATNRSVIYCMIDGRGSGLKGDDMLFAIYRGMGTVEIEDQISVTRQLQQQFPYVDAARSAIWGWSYGGYATAMAMAKDVGGVFKCGASVAPVTSWIYYDTIYTERYMGLPTEEDNMAGYNASDVTRRVDNFRNKQYFLLHGNADDNVHYQQSMALTKALERQDILFRQQSYPDENHSIRGLILHVYRSMDRFWTDCFDLTD